MQKKKPEEICIGDRYDSRTKLISCFMAVARQKSKLGHTQTNPFQQPDYC